MSGQDEVTWSKEPPSEEGFYWAKFTGPSPYKDAFAIYGIEAPEPEREPYPINVIFADSGRKFIEYIGGDTTWEVSEFISLGNEFGPPLPSPAALTAAAKRVEELEGENANFRTLHCEYAKKIDALQAERDRLRAAVEAAMQWWEMHKDDVCETYQGSIESVFEQEPAFVALATTALSAKGEQ